MANSGIFSPNDIVGLMDYQEWRSIGDLELIETQTVRSSGSTIDFTSIKQGDYQIHFMTYNNMSMTSASGNQIPYYRLSNDGGTTFESSNYQSTGQFNNSAESAAELTTRTSYGHLFGHQQSSYKWNGYCYFYNLGDSSKYSFSTFHAVGFYSSDSSQSMVFGSSAYKVTETINAIRLSVDDTTLASGTASLYGIRTF